ncbi:MAG: hypothetical protein PUF50_02685 [Erysipelotrichaceae bacterium]|nr:hypothetical protein [Erysipelotrichaceae bacterium]
MKIAIRRKEITPKEPMYLAGHAIRVHRSEGVLDPLYCTVLYIEGNENVCFVTLDVVMVDEEYSYQMKQIIADQLSIEPNHVFVSFLHNHSGPEFTKLNAFTKTTEYGADPAYLDWVKQVIVETVGECINHTQEVTAYSSCVTIEGYYGNRNSNDLPSDRRVDLIQYRDQQGNPVGGWMNFTCHSTVLGPKNYMLSADLAGAIRQQLEDAYQMTMCAFIGASGDISNRQYRQGNDATELKRMSEGITQQILAQTQWTPVTLEPIHVAPYEYVIDYKRDFDEIRKNIEKTEQELQQDIPFGQRQLLTSGLAIQKNKLQEDPQVHVSLKGAFIEMGDYVLVTVPAELFTKFGLQIKRCLQNKKVLIFGYTDYSIGYMVEEDEYGKNYESMASHLQKGDPEKFADFIVEQLQNQYHE